MAVPVRRLSIHFVATHSSAADNSKKITKNPYLGSSRSFKVINIDTNKKQAASACYDRQHVRAYLQTFLC